MKININKTVAAVPAAILAAHGGKSLSHTATATEVINAVDTAVRYLGDMGIPKNAQAGCRFVFTSGGPRMPNAYKYARIVTRYTIERGSSAWFLVECAADELYPNQHGGFQCLLTAFASVQAHYAFKAKFSVIKPAIAALEAV